MIIQIIFAVAVLAILVYIAITVNFIANFMPLLKIMAEDSFHNSMKSYFGIRILCKLNNKVDLDKFCEEYTKQYQNMNNNEEDK